LGHAARLRDKEVDKNFERHSDAKRPLGKRGRRIKQYFQEVLKIIMI
jgi:hypothetical protein